MTLRCNDALPLVPSYVDGELSEAQARPLREHLLDCRDCRGAAQDLKGLSRWFASDVDDPNALVPSGFAARVARRAFAGDTGQPEPAFPGLSSPAERGSDPIGFVRELTGLAAAVLVALAVGFRMQQVPSGERLRADEMLSFQEIEQRFEDLNERAPEPAPEQATEPEAR